MTAAINGLIAITNSVTGLRNYILVSPNAVQGYQPYGQSGPVTIQNSQPLPNAFMFHYEGEQTVSCTSDITDHYVEDNTAIQDNIALAPIEITTQGYIGELNNVPPIILSTVQTLAQKLTSIVEYAPSLSITAQLAYNQAFQLYQVATNAAKAVVEGLTGLTLQNEQQKAFSLFFGYWQTRTFFFVQTPWASFPNMAIKTLRPIQSADTRVITNFEITFKQINTVQAVIITPPRTSVSQNQASTQSAPQTNLGVSQPSVAVDQGASLSMSYPAAFPSQFVPPATPSI